MLDSFKSSRVKKLRVIHSNLCSSQLGRLSQILNHYKEQTTKNIYMQCYTRIIDDSGKLHYFLFFCSSVLNLWQVLSWNAHVEINQALVNLTTNG